MGDHSTVVRRLHLETLITKQVAKVERARQKLRDEERILEELQASLGSKPPAKRR